MNKHDRRLLNLLSRNLRKQRESQGIGLREAAAQAGVSFNSFSRYERGEFNQRSLKTFLKLCRWAGMPLSADEEE